MQGCDWLSGERENEKERGLPVWHASLIPQGSKQTKGLNGEVTYAKPLYRLTRGPSLFRYTNGNTKRGVLGVGTPIPGGICHVQLALSGDWSTSSGDLEPHRDSCGPQLIS